MIQHGIQHWRLRAGVTHPLAGLVGLFPAPPPGGCPGAPQLVQAPSPANLAAALGRVLAGLVQFPLLHGTAGEKGWLSLCPSPGQSPLPSRCSALFPLAPRAGGGAEREPDSPYLSLLCRAACLRSQQYRIR